MAEKRPTSKNTPDDKSKKKGGDTVQLTAEDLRKISGGATVPKPPVQPQDVKKK
jgi:hypothetical protein